MAGRDLQQRKRWTIGFPATLLPIAQRVNADFYRSSKICLAQPNETSQGGNVLAGGKTSPH
jgi:hypothetical protein